MKKLPSTRPPKPRLLAVLSDSTGDMGERFMRGLISQFPGQPISFRVFSFVRAADDVEKIFRTIADERPVIFHSTIDKAMKREIRRRARAHRWPAYDITGGAMVFLEKALRRKSFEHFEGLHGWTDSEYDKRIESVDFTVSHDDGLNPEHLAQADIVLVGVSRVSKTPTSVYLANKGYKVANVPLVKGLALQEAVTRIRGLKIVGLTILPEKLRDIRLQRTRQFGMAGTDYTQLEAIREELNWAHSLMLELRCPTIDVTHLAVEETAALVLKSLHLR
jgi:regulator of PEP synthase PpsR (kinase-PPPase family)